MWKITRIEDRGKYFVAILPEHPHADKRGRVYLHRVLMENHLGRLLESWEIPHHKNLDGKDNRIENLEVLTRLEHNRHHHRKAVMGSYVCAHCGNPIVKPVRKARGKLVFCNRVCSASYYVPRREKKPIRHGTNTGYGRGCRCDQCRAAHTEAVMKWKHSGPRA